jgi:hypothetical protein
MMRKMTKRMAKEPITRLATTISWPLEYGLMKFGVTPGGAADGGAPCLANKCGAGLMTNMSKLAAFFKNVV